MEIVFKLNRKEDVIKIAKKRQRERNERKKITEKKQAEIDTIHCVLFHFTSTFFSLSLSLRISNIFTKRIVRTFICSESSISVCSRECMHLVTLLNAMCRYAYIMAFTDMVIRKQKTENFR